MHQISFEKHIQTIRKNLEFEQAIITAERPLTQL
jgi:hypothetical protein